MSCHPCLTINEDTIQYNSRMKKLTSMSYALKRIGVDWKDSSKTHRKPTLGTETNKKENLEPGVEVMARVFASCQYCSA